MISQTELKSLLNYNPETGLFTWKVYRQRVKAGSVAGTKHLEGYINIGINGKQYRAHRLAWFYMTGKFPKEQIDHINRVRDDNRFANLREATVQQNNQNAGLRKDNFLRIKGVTMFQGKFQASARLNGKKKHLGSFSTKEEASLAYQIYTKQHFGEFYSGGSK